MASPDDPLRSDHMAKEPVEDTDPSTLSFAMGQKHRFLWSQSLSLGSGVSGGILQGIFPSSSFVTLQVLGGREMGMD
ncbi:hypothetical protein U0070_009886 [Myodes glareolus]|uniref:Uncharacterized protein n=1 Tax=Myodes glareolus TaxID=447135 RepID=A0AAW0JH64_MYOGA